MYHMHLLHAQLQQQQSPVQCSLNHTFTCLLQETGEHDININMHMLVCVKQQERAGVYVSDVCMG